jgi:hypothetical protein
MNEAQKEREQDEWIASQIEHLMSAGQKCDPMNADNILESLSQMDEANLNLFAGYVRKANNDPLCKKVTNHVFLADFIVNNNKQYWLNCATTLAKRDWEERIV